ncbi:hypothetical protein RhiirA5_495250 [Rhizophagus irregularis]|uniref:Methylated-DNA--protein-cysteine methyltransferase n=1 Tax=Rhizophagus irregularis TaxID=588596 RepID=A0A2N0Q6A0_9GLOM|nr:hypothetical protein RhiirA5_495250 [Rhizophagus irregularis]
MMCSIADNNYTSELLNDTENVLANSMIINSSLSIYFPLTENDRKSFKNLKTGRIITEFQFKVYDLCSQIPEGYVSTYKSLATALSSSPRAVGNALRVNPFAPSPIPCHRVIASNFFIGGFDGEWFGRDKKGKVCDQDDNKNKNEKINSKLERLAKEGVFFDNEGWLIESQRSSHIFNNFSQN